VFRCSGIECFDYSLCDGPCAAMHGRGERWSIFIELVELVGGEGGGVFGAGPAAREIETGFGEES